MDLLACVLRVQLLDFNSVIVEFAQFSVGNCFKSFRIFVSIVYVVIATEKIEFEFCRALVNNINMQQKEKRT